MKMKTIKKRDLAIDLILGFAWGILAFRELIASFGIDLGWTKPYPHWFLFMSFMVIILHMVIAFFADAIIYYQNKTIEKQ